MIRSIIALRFKAGSSADQIAQLLEAMRALRVEGMTALDCGLDLGKREGNWDFALVADFVDMESYLRYDSDKEHRRIRRDLAAEITDSAVRVQFELP